MRRAILPALLVVALGAGLASAAGERRVSTKTNGGTAKGTIVGGTFHAPRSMRLEFVAKPKTPYVAYAEMTCDMAGGKTAEAKVKRTVRTVEYALRVPLPKGTLRPTGTCRLEAGGLKVKHLPNGNSTLTALRRTRLKVTLYGTFGPPVITPAVLEARLGNSYVGGNLYMSELHDVEGNSKPKIAYGWERCDAAGANCAEIAGATAIEYRAQAADTGMRLRGRLTATTVDGNAVAHTAPSAPISAEEFDPGG